MGSSRRLPGVRRGARSRRALIAAVAVAAVAAGAVFAARGLRRVYVYSDRSILRGSPSSTRVRSVLWSVPRELPVERPGGAPSAAASVPRAEGSLRPSVGSIAYAEKNGERGFDIFFAELGPGGRPAPARVPAMVNSPYDEVRPALSADGDLLVFASDRPGGFGGFDLYASRRARGGLAESEWEEPRNFGGRVNSPYDDLSPALSPSGEVLVFSTVRPRSFLLAPPADWDDVIRERWRPGDSELAYVALLEGASAARSDPRPLPGVSSAARDIDPSFSPAGDFLYFASDRAGGLGGYDLYRVPVEIAGGPEGPELRFGTPENLGRPVNSAFDETSPISFLEGYALAYAASDPRSGSRVLLETRSREVRSGVEFGRVPLGAVLSRLRPLAGPAAAIALVAALGVLALRYRRAWQPSLLARSAMGAVFAHALLLSAFYFWVVTGDIVSSAKKEEIVEVSVERLLQTKISLAARKVEVEVSPVARAARETGPAALERLAPEPVLESPEAAPSEPAPRTLAAPLENPILARIERPEPPAPRAADFAEPAPLPASRAPAELPEPAPRAPSEEAVAAPAAPPAARPTVEDPVRPEAPMSVEDLYESLPTEIAREETRPPAATQVQAPVLPEPVLPPLAAAPLEPPRLAAKLPVPAQAPPAAEEPESAGSPRAPLASQLDVRSAEAVRDPPRTVPAEPSEALGRLAARAGMVPAPSPLEGAFEVPEAKLERASPDLPSPVSARRLPEALPLAERPSQGDDLWGGLHPRTGERLLEAPVEIALAIESPRAALEAGPLAARSESRDPVVAAAPLDLASRPSPGAPVPPAAARPSPGPEIPKRRLPGPEALLGSPAAEPADVLLPRPSLAQRAEPSASAFEVHDRGEEPALAAKVAPAALRSSLEAPASPPLELALPRTAPALPAVSGRAAKLPEARAIIFDPARPGDYRAPAARRLLAREFGGTDATEAAVLSGLRWLAAHQSRDGRWDVDGFDAACRGCGSPGFLVDCDVAVTGLAVLAFLGQNHSPANAESPFRRNVQKALDWLARVQTADGLIAGDDGRYTMYSHGIATLALSEAYLLTRDPALPPVLERAARAIVSSQNPSTGGWRYRPEPPPRGDTSVSGWQVMALASLRRSGVSVPEVVFERARHWFDFEAAGGDHRGIYGYTGPDEPRAAMVAEGMYARLLLGARRTDRNMDEAARYIEAETRGGRLLNNLYLLYYGNLALFNYQGWIWDQWNRQVREHLLRSQKRGGPEEGSWDPTCPWSETGGRVLATAFAVLTLEVYYRYLPLYWEAEGSANVLAGSE